MEAELLLLCVCLCVFDSRAEELAARQAAETEAQQQHRQKHIATCLTSLHCLVSELKEIYVVRGVVASGDQAGASGR